MAQDYIIKIEGSWPSGETEYVIGTDDPERLPVVSASDNGDVLTVVDGKWKDAAPSGGGGLPSVTSDDNGDVLTVVNGEWAKAAPSGGGVTVIDINSDLYAPEVSGAESLWVYYDGTWSEFSNDVYIYDGNITVFSTIPIFTKFYDAENGTTIKYINGIQQESFIGSATDPNTGDTEGLYLTADTTGYFVSDDAMLSAALILPSTATFAVGHFSTK